MRWPSRVWRNAPYHRVLAGQRWRLDRVASIALYLRLNVGPGLTIAAGGLASIRAGLRLRVSAAPR